MPDRPADLPRHVLFVERWSGVSSRPPQIALLLEWRHDEDGWHGLVAHAHAGGLLTRWVRSEELKPFPSFAGNEASPRHHEGDGG